jgi:hypothetical protein
MLWTMAVILFVLWGLGMVSGAQLGLWVHLFLCFSFICGVLALLSGARTTRRELAP